MKVFELIDHLVSVDASQPYRDNRVKREIVEGVLCGVHGNVHLNDELSRITGEMLVTKDSWVIFSKSRMTPSRILVIDPVTRNIAYHAVQQHISEAQSIKAIKT